MANSWGGRIKGMKTICHTYMEIISLDNLLRAWEEFERGKKKRADVRLFSRALLCNILKLQNELSSFEYQHSSYESFSVSDPKPRQIHKALVRDRLVHHAIYRVLYPAFDSTFIHDSYSCRVGKGTHRAFEQLVTYVRKVSCNYSEPCFALKLDIRKFFNSIDHQVLLGLLRKRLSDPGLLMLLEKIIRSFEHSPGKGLPLGNLTSQLFANVYLDPLDKFVKHRLQVRYYLRYADDFLILSSSEEELMGYFVEIWRFLKEELKLELHPNKISLRKFAQGIDFVGYMALPHYNLPRRKTVQRMFRNLERVSDLEKLPKVLESYLGYLGHANSWTLKQALLKDLAYYT